jgi:SAM-dependent methyltransferase
MAQNSETIRESVREHYAQQARSGGSCCGGSNGLYPASLLTSVPEDVANFSLGCGNPFGIASLKPGETVLDLGSGGGLDCFLAAKQVGESGHVIGVDMTPEMLERARIAATRLAIKNVEFRSGYLEKLPVDSATVDVVISNCVINLSPDKPQVFREIFRVLEPGGRVAVSDSVTDGPLSADLRKDMDAWGACISGALDVNDYISGLTASGFTDVKVQPNGDDSQEIESAGIKGRVFSAIITALKPI